MKKLFGLLAMFSPVAALAQEVEKSVAPAVASTTPAAEAAAQGPGLTSLVFQLLIIFAIFYFLLIRPQNKKHREHLATIAAVKKGDKILVNGIVGIVTFADEKTKFADVEIANGVKIEVLKSSITEVLEKK